MATPNEDTGDADALQDAHTNKLADIIDNHLLPHLQKLNQEGHDPDFLLTGLLGAAVILARTSGLGLEYLLVLLEELTDYAKARLTTKSGAESDV